MATATAQRPASSLKMTATAGGGSYDLCPEGNHPGVLVAVVDLGTISDRSRSGKVQDVRSIALFWELPGEIKPDGDPFIVALKFALSFDGRPNFGEKSGLRLLVEGWFGKKFEVDQEFDLSNLLGRAGLVNVIHARTAAGKDVHKVDGVKSIPKGLTVPKAHHELLLYTTDMGPPPDLSWLPYLFGQPVADIIAASKEFGGAGGGAARPGTNGPPPAGGVTDADGEQPPF